MFSEKSQIVNISSLQIWFPWCVCPEVGVSSYKNIENISVMLANVEGGGIC